jgi:biotin synthase-like enzyme
MKKNCLLVSPASIFDPKDPFTTGVVFMPIGLAYGAAALKELDITPQVLDLFGENPTRIEKLGGYFRLGASDESMLIKIEENEPEYILFYANQLVNHVALIRSIELARQSFPDQIIGLAENTQAVTAYSLQEVSNDLFESGIDFILTGEMEESILEVSMKILEKVPAKNWNVGGVIAKEGARSNAPKLVNLDKLKFPAWELFPVENYWKIGYAHGPFETKKYLPILTSRGCPFPCKFCVVPSTNNRKWRFRSAENIVDEIEAMTEQFGVEEFHLEDLNPTILDSRMQEIAQEILKRELKINWKIVAGTKIESIKSVETLSLMARAGLTYLSMSPESGSKRVLREIGKPFDVNHALKMIKACNHLGIKTQSCFVIGYPTEKFIDRLRSLALVLKLTLVGIDEVVVFIMSPVPGSAVYSEYQGHFSSLSSLSFTPRWRVDFNTLLIWRILMYSTFLFFKLFRSPIKVVRQIRNLFTGNYQTKMEMTPIRGLKYLNLVRKFQNWKFNSRLQN